MQIIMLHPMKTAGTSVRHFFKDNAPKYNNKHFILGGTGHYTPNEILWRFDCEDNLFETSFKISYSRNPYDRLVSFYHHMQTYGGHAEGLCKRWSFAQFATHPQLRKIMIPLSAYRTHGVDFLVRFETLNEDVHKLIDSLEYEHTAHLFHTAWPKYEKLCATKHSYYEEYYTEEIKEYVYATYLDDFIQNGYQK